MRKLLILIIVSLFICCSKDDSIDKETTPSTPSKKEYKLDKVNLTGIWKDVTYIETLFSFSDDKLFCGILDYYTIDDGDYSIDGDTIKVNNSYLGYNIRFEVSSVSDNSISGYLRYLALSEYGDAYENARFITFKKTDESPCERKNALIGKTFSTRTTYNGDSKYNYSVIQYNMMTYTLTAYESGLVRGNGTAHYLYIPPNIYYTVYRDTGVFLHVGQKVLNTRIVDIDKDGRVSLRQK